VFSSIIFYFYLGWLAVPFAIAAWLSINQIKRNGGRKMENGKWKKKGS
jgi:hypothetical protein